jgi:hypothetical protein
LHLCRFFLFSFPDATGRLITLPLVANRGKIRKEAKMDDFDDFNPFQDFDFDEWEEFSDPEVFEDYYLDDGYDEENDPPYGWDDGW